MVEIKSRGGHNEWKWFDEDLQSVSSAVSGVVIDSLLKIPQGTDVSSRVGNKVTLKSVSLRGTATLDVQSTSLSNGLLRVILFIDKQSSGFGPLVADVLTTATFTSHYNQNNKDRFVILKDKIYDIPLMTTTSATTQATYKPFNIYVACNVDVDWNTTNAAIPQTNNVGILYITNGAWVNSCSTGYSRCRYSDD